MEGQTGDVDAIIGWSAELSIGYCIYRFGSRIVHVAKHPGVHILLRIDELNPTHHLCQLDGVLAWLYGRIQLFLARLFQWQ